MWNKIRQNEGGFVLCDFDVNKVSRTKSEKSQFWKCEIKFVKSKGDLDVNKVSRIKCQKTLKMWNKIRQNERRFVLCSLDVNKISRFFSRFVKNR